MAQEWGPARGGIAGGGDGFHAEDDCSAAERGAWKAAGKAEAVGRRGARLRVLGLGRETSAEVKEFRARPCVVFWRV